MDACAIRRNRSNFARKRISFEKIGSKYITSCHHLQETPYDVQLAQYEVLTGLGTSQHERMQIALSVNRFIMASLVCVNIRSLSLSLSARLKASGVLKLNKMH